MKYLILCFSLFFTAVISFTSCTGKLDAGEIDLVAWKKDRNGCLGLRLKQEDEIRKIKNSFLAKYNQEIIKTFGRPDRVELIDRSQSFFIYFLEPSERCDQNMAKDPLKVLFRMNAINKVSEVTVTTLNP